MRRQARAIRVCVKFLILLREFTGYALGFRYAPYFQKFVKINYLLYDGN